jgi:hypothetical protein
MVHVSVHSAILRQRFCTQNCRCVFLVLKLIDAVHYVLHTSNRSRLRRTLLRCSLSAVFVFCVFVWPCVFVCEAFSLLICVAFVYDPCSCGGERE